MDLDDPFLKNDVTYIEHLLEAGILKQMSPDLFPGEEGTTNIWCSDGDQARHAMMSHWELCSGRDCHHMLMLNGLPLLVAKNSPAAEIGCESDLVLAHAWAGCKLKRVNTVTINGHWPCGIAYEKRLSVEQSLQIYCEGKDNLRAYFKRKADEDADPNLGDYLRRRLQEPTLVLSMHVDHYYWPKQSFKRRYYFDREIWEKWNAGRSTLAG